MKKILLIIMLCLPFLQNVKANIKESFYPAEKISNIYIKKVKGDVIKYRQARFIRNSNDESIAYCIEPFEIMKENQEYTGYDTNQAKYAGISNDVWKKISLIAYYGYGYNNHDDDKWYAITQNMIWSEIDKEASFYFTDGLNGPKVSTFDNEIKEINTLVNNHNKLPSFIGKDYIFSINSNNVLEDINKVLDGFQIISANNTLNIEINNNKLIINTEKPMVETLSFEKKYTDYNKKTIVFVDDSYQNVLTPGNVDSLKFSLKVFAIGGKIKITKIDADTKEKKELGQGKIVGSVYEIFDENKNIVDTLVINEDFESESKLLPLGKYTIKEKESKNGYLLDEKEYNVEINSNNTYVELMLENQVIKSKIELYKYFDQKLESGISFEIYDSDNSLVDTLITDEQGKIQKELYYGTYRFHQLNTTKNYLKVDDFEVKVDENSERIIRLDLYDKKFSCKLVISKVDSNKNVITSSEAIFKIYDLTNNKYVLINNSSDLITNNGRLIINSLEAGEYEIEELRSPKGYKKLNSKTRFKIDEDNDFIYEESNPVYNIDIENEEIIVDVPNTGINYPHIYFIRIYLKKKLTVFG